MNTSKGGDLALSFNPRIKAKLKGLPDFVINNLDSIRTIRKNCHFSFNFIAKTLGVKSHILLEWELAERIPSKNEYNKLAAFFDWEVWQ